MQASNLHDTESVRSGMVQVNDIIKGYMNGTYKSETNQEMKHIIIENHWRKIIRVDIAIAKELRSESERRALRRQADKYVLNWSTIVNNASIDKKLLRKEVGKWTHEDACNGTFFSMLCQGSRSVSVMDPWVTFMPYTEYRKKFEKDHGTVNHKLKIGVETSSGISMDVEKALQLFRESHLIVQIGLAKDRTDNANKYTSGPKDPDWVQPSIVIKPCLLYESKIVCDMIEKVRKFHNLDMSTRPIGPDARKEIRKKFNIRAAKRCLMKKWNVLLQHAPKIGDKIGTHIFRGLYGTCSVSDFMGHKQRIYELTGKMVSDAFLMAHLLAHRGSLSTTMRYNKFYVIY